jgi:hypothetical protein
MANNDHKPAGTQWLRDILTLGGSLDCDSGAEYAGKSESNDERPNGSSQRGKLLYDSLLNDGVRVPVGACS